MLKAYRIESKGKGIASASYAAGIMMTSLELREPTLDYWEANYEHWFTPYGYKRIGLTLVRMAKEWGYPVKIRKATVPQHLIHYADPDQVVIQQSDKNKIIPWKRSL